MTKDELRDALISARIGLLAARNALRIYGPKTCGRVMDALVAEGTPLGEFQAPTFTRYAPPEDA